MCAAKRGCPGKRMPCGVSDRRSSAFIGGSTLLGFRQGRAMIREHGRGGCSFPGVPQLDLPLPGVVDRRG